jgi:hypothetical protein
MKNKQNSIFDGNAWDEETACIGKNGGSFTLTRDSKIADGFAENVELIYSALIKRDGTADTLVYPLYFSARHYTELSIKVITRIANEVQRIRSGVKSSIPRIHDICSLYPTMENLLLKTDRRFKEALKECQDILPLLNDFSEDKQGDLFRYTFGKTDADVHLDQYSRFSTSLFVEHFRKVRMTLDYLLEITERILDEYCQTKSFTSMLSRNDLIMMTSMLSKGKTEQEICSYFGLSSSEYLERKKLINSLPFLSIQVGKEIILHSFSQATVVATKLIISADRRSDHLVNSAELVYPMNKEDIPYLLAFSALMNGYEFAETYNSLKDNFKKSLALSNPMYILGYIRDGEDLKKGMLRCGQVTMTKLFFSDIS